MTPFVIVVEFKIHEGKMAALRELMDENARAYITFPLGGVPTVAELDSHAVQKPGEHIDLDLDMNRAVPIDPDTNRVM